MQNVAVDLPHEPVRSVTIELRTPNARLSNNTFISEASHVQAFSVEDDVQPRLPNVSFNLFKFVLVSCRALAVIHDTRIVNQMLVLISQFDWVTGYVL